MKTKTKIFMLFLLFFLVFTGGTYLFGQVAEHPRYGEPNLELARQYYSGTIVGAIILGIGIAIYILSYILEKRKQKKAKQIIITGR